MQFYGQFKGPVVVPVRRAAVISAGPSVTDTRPRPQAGSVCVREETSNDNNMRFEIFTPRDVHVGSEGGDLLKGRLEEVGESHAFRAVTALDSKSEKSEAAIKKPRLTC